MIVQNVQQESPISPAQKNILIINRSISLQTRNADCDNYKINLPNSQFSISFIESRPSELELSLNPSEQDQRFRSETKRETQQSQNRHGFSCQKKHRRRRHLRRALQGAHAPQLHLRHLRRRRRLLRRKGQLFQFSHFNFIFFLAEKSDWNDQENDTL